MRETTYGVIYIHQQWYKTAKKAEEVFVSGKKGKNITSLGGFVMRVPGSENGAIRFLEFTSCMANWPYRRDAFRLPEHDKATQ